MNSLEFNFEVLEPDFPDATIPSPQIVVFNLDISTKRIEVHFMENTAASIVDGKVNSAMGTLNLWYIAESQSGAYAMSMNARKIAYTFQNSQGIAQNVKFHGRRKHPKS